ncbi:MAG: GIY-YIG nuclease family protein [Alphaproteobacteria bacterium]|nr:GIY-YIG nuclease family protein [Alphaproteobacteria bacterium]
MPIQFNNLLTDAGIDLTKTILVRHRDDDPYAGQSVCSLWRQSLSQFDAYQSRQAAGNRAEFSRAEKWASFIGLRDGKTVFVGLYDAKYSKFDAAQNTDMYLLSKNSALSEYDGKLFIEWGDGARAWVQRAERRNKAISELRLKFEEDPFPGFPDFIQSLSNIDSLPHGWVEVLKNSRGIYLLVCPTTREQYVGSVSGKEGFWQRWQSYVRTGHGGNVKLKSRELSDYQVSILEIAGDANEDQIPAMESRWKRKLLTREMGLNSN